MWHVHVHVDRLFAGHSVAAVHSCEIYRETATPRQRQRRSRPEVANVDRRPSTVNLDTLTPHAQTHTAGRTLDWRACVCASCSAAELLCDHAMTGGQTRRTRTLVAPCTNRCRSPSAIRAPNDSYTHTRRSRPHHKCTRCHFSAF